MKKNLLLFVVIALFVISCSSDEESLPCITIADCPDSSFVCLDGECVVGTADEGAADNDGGNGGGSGTSDDNDSNGGGSSSDNDNGGNSGLPDPTPSDDDTDSTADDDSDADTSDSGSDNDADTDTSDSGSDDDTDTSDTDTSDSGSDDDTDTSDTDTSDSGSDDDTDTDTSDSGSDNDTDTDTSDSGSDDDTDTDTSDSGDSGHDAEEPADLGSCAAAIAALPHGGKYDWDDGEQGFSTNNYWKRVENSVIPARSGYYSFGAYSANKGYSQNMDYTSVLEPADLSACKECMVKATFYAKGKNYFSTCTTSNQTFIHPTCNGEGTTTATNASSVPWSQTPASPWVLTKEDSGAEFITYATGCRYMSETIWVDEANGKPIMWTIPETCKTDKFVFGLRFRSDGSVEGHGIVVDDLTIYATTKNEPKGGVESAENGKITGWACDPDAYPEKVLVKVKYYKNKDESVVAAERTVYADSEKTGLTECGGTYNHGFEVPLDAELAGILGEGTHSATVFAGDIPADCSGAYKEIGKTDLTVPANYDPKK